MNLKYLLTLCFVLLLSLIQSFSQTSRWLWESAGTGPNTTGTEGTAISTVPSKDYVPATRENASAVADSAGNLWLYGGRNEYTANALWRYNTATSEWTRFSVSSSDSAPTFRNYASSWIDKDGNYWLFGGIEGDNPNLSIAHYDLWKFSIAANKWSLVKPESFAIQGVYGTQGVPSLDNHPGRRYQCVSWREGDDLWLYSGYGWGYQSQSYSIRYLNDVWRYNITTNEWTWMAGDIFGNGPDNSYGEKGVPSPSNFPGSRSGATFQTDKNGTLWMYGGGTQRYGSQYGFGYLNDLWKYDIADGIWTWMAGDTTIKGGVSVYGIKGIAADANTPGSRSLMCSFADSSGNFWLFGGALNRNDLWKFDISTNQWIWIDGDSTRNAVRVYGADGTGDPGGRQSMAAWTDSRGQFWMFGGSYQTTDGFSNKLNDLWTYTASQVLPVKLLSFTGTIAGKSAVLSWTTAQSVNNKGFTVQKSGDGKAYSDVGFVANTGANQYAFTDANLAAGTSLYRLKLVDVNGSVTYSPVVNLDYSSFTWSVVNTSASSYVQLQLDRSSQVSVQVVSMSGTVIQSVGKGRLEAGSYTIPFNMPKASPGIYTVKLLVNDKSFTKKIMSNR